MAPSILSAWNYCSSIPLIGQWIFSWIVSFFAPYTGTIPFRVKQLDSSKCVSAMTEYFWIKNPFNSVHAAALTNMGEGTMGMAIFAWAETNHYRAIPTKLIAEFHQKAKGRLSGVCDLSSLEITKDFQDIQTKIYNQKNELVCTVTGTWKFTPLKKSQ